MTSPFDRQQFLQDLQQAVELQNHAAELGTKFGKGSFRRLFFVACGAPNRSMSVSEYWANRIATRLDIRRYFPTEFVHQDPLALDHETLVILGSHSGTTEDTVQAAEFLRKKPCTTLAITQINASPLAQYSDLTIAYGQGNQGYYSAFLLLQSFVSAFLQETENWKWHDQVMRSLQVFPESLADTFQRQDEKAAEVAQRLKEESMIYLVGAGPVYCTTYVIAVCILMEMQWMHAHPLIASEFFHGPFEAFDDRNSLILLLGEDPSRPEAERVARFCKTISNDAFIYDSKEFLMNGIDEAIRLSLLRSF